MTVQEDLHKILGSRLKEAREKKGLSQVQLSDNLSLIYGIKLLPASISAYEKGKTLPSLTAIVTICKILSCSLDWVCGLGDTTENRIYTYSDLAKLLINIQGLCPERAHITSGHNDYSNQSVAELVFFDDTLANFFSEWEDIEKLHSQGTLDDEMYKLVLEALMNKDKYQNNFPYEEELDEIPF